MNERQLTKAYAGKAWLGGRRVLTVERISELENGAAVCPGFRNRPCMAIVPAGRILCYFCRRSAELEHGKAG